MASIHLSPLAFIATVVVFPLGLLTAACGDGSATNDGSGTDSSYVPYEGDPGNWQAGEAVASIPCDGGLVDIWSFWVDDGQAVVVAVDTIATDTAFDPVLTLMLEDPAQSGFEPDIIGEGDDEMDCSFAPPSGRCPRVEVTASGSGIAYVVIGEKGVCAGPGGVYRMTAEVDGSPAPLTIEEDDSSLGDDDEGGHDEHR